MSDHEERQSRVEILFDIIDAGLAPADDPTAYQIDNEHDVVQVDDALDRWRIDGEKTATWAANKLRRAEAVRASAHAVAEDLRALAAEHEATAERSTDWDVRYFTGKLRQYHEAAIAGTKKHTTTVIGAKLADRAGGVSAEVVDQVGAVEWAEDHDAELVNYVDPTIDKGMVKAKYGDKISEEAGSYPAMRLEAEAGSQVVPGVNLVRGPRSFSVTLTDLPVDEG